MKFGAGEFLTEFADRVLVRNSVGLGDVEEVMETAAVENLILGLLVGKTVKGLQNEDLEHEHRMERGTPTGSFGIGDWDAIQHGKKYLPVHDRVDLPERVAHRLNLLEPVGLVE